MDATQPNAHRIFYRDTDIEWLWMIGYALTAAFFVWRGVSADTDAGRWFRFVLAAIPVLAFLFEGAKLLIPSRRLELDPLGYTDRSLVIPYRTLWSDVTDFRMESVLGVPVIMGTMTESGMARRSPIVRFLYRISGHKGGIDPSGFTESGDTVLATLQDFRRRYG